MTSVSENSKEAKIPASLLQPCALRFWLAFLCTGVGAGVGAIILTRVLQIIQHLVWVGSGTNILEAATGAGAWRHVIVLLSAGIVLGIGQLVLYLNLIPDQKIKFG